MEICATSSANITVEGACSTGRTSNSESRFSISLNDCSFDVCVWSVALTVFNSSLLGLYCCLDLFQFHSRHLPIMRRQRILL